MCPCVPMQWIQRKSTPRDQQFEAAVAYYKYNLMS